MIEWRWRWSSGSHCSILAWLMTLVYGGRCEMNSQVSARKTITHRIVITGL